METVEEEIICMKTNMFGNVGPAAYIQPLKRPAQTACQAGSSNFLSFVSNQRGIGNCRRSMEGAEDEELTIKKIIFPNVRLAACTRPPKRLAQTASHVGPSDRLCFASDQRWISSCGMSVEAAEKEELTMGNSFSVNVRVAACTRPPKRPAQNCGSCRTI